MNKKLMTIFLAVFAMNSFGCSLYNINFEDVTNTSHPAKSSPADVVYLETVDRPSEIIGYVMVSTERRTPIDQVIQKLKPQAALLGGDAVTNIESDSSGFWKRPGISKVLGNAYIRINYRAQVVAFK